MITIEKIKDSNCRELFVGEDGVEAIPNTLINYLKTVDILAPINDTIFSLVLRYYAFDTAGLMSWSDTSHWLDDDVIRGFVLIKGSLNYLCLLTQEQVIILSSIDKDLKCHPNSASSHYNVISKVLEDYELKVNFSSLSAEELNLPIVKKYMIPENSKSLEIAENTSRFSGAIWFEEIKKKTITLAGVGGIGSYVCFLLARMQPKSMFIYDDDSVEYANMSGQLYRLVDLGHTKVDSIAQTVHEYAGYDSVFSICSKFTEESEASDIMICGFDNMAARKLFFNKWLAHVQDKPADKRKNCLFIDGRLSAECLQVFCFAGDDAASLLRYENSALFSDAEADETVCSYKQTTYMANMIGSLIVNLFTNFVANEVAGAPIRDLPYFTSYDGNSMQLKTTW